MKNKMKKVNRNYISEKDEMFFYIFFFFYAFFLVGPCFS